MEELQMAVCTSADIRAHVDTLAGASQKLDVNERREHRLRCDQVKAPQPLHLLRRQRQARDLEILGAYELEPIGDVCVSPQHIYVLASPESLTPRCRPATSLSRSRRPPLPAKSTVPSP